MMSLCEKAWIRIRIQRGAQNTDPSSGKFQDPDSSFLRQCIWIHNTGKNRIQRDIESTEFLEFLTQEPLLGQLYHQCCVSASLWRTLIIIPYSNSPHGMKAITSMILLFLLSKTHNNYGIPLSASIVFFFQKHTQLPVISPWFFICTPCVNEWCVKSLARQNNVSTSLE